METYSLSLIHIFAGVQVFFDLPLGQNGADQQDCRRPQHLRLIDHVFVYGKVLPQAGDGGRPGDLLQMPAAAQKPFGLSEH